jgi:hypothetical protein
VYTRTKTWRDVNGRGWREKICDCWKLAYADAYVDLLCEKNIVCSLKSTAEVSTEEQSENCFVKLYTETIVFIHRLISFYTLKIVSGIGLLLMKRQSTVHPWLPILSIQ